ncbi:Nodal modulator 2 [Echinococcus granulosus]|uniref:Nodal modulator 2 n=1 Tax=Echinococcus granulosus TaxID=6210 RepID=W6U846_ECHGR|nr:Nodal modulator 2 [Echinococcus granulosus]EUB56526.1 Nodal modulator 2 [Echinococcus granulosus]
MNTRDDQNNFPSPIPVSLQDGTANPAELSREINDVAENLPDETLRQVVHVLPNGAYSVVVSDSGRYRICLSVPRGWNFLPANGYEIDLNGGIQNEQMNYVFDLTGFDVSGQVVTAGMTTGPPDLIVSVISNGAIFSQAKTTANGSFTLSSVPPGKYIVTVGDPASDSETNDVRASLSITVSTSSLKLADPLVLQGHSLRSVVTFNDQGVANIPILLFIPKSSKLTETDFKKFGCFKPSKPHANFIPVDLKDIINPDLACQVFVNGDFVTRTNSEGNFELDLAAPSEYLLQVGFISSNFGLSQVKAPRLEFEKVRLKLTPTMKTLPTFVPNAVEFCGRFLMTSSLKPGTRIPRVEIVSGPSIEATVSEDAKSAKFCLYLSPGKHTLRLVESHNSIRFAPASINVCSRFLKYLFASFARLIFWGFFIQIDILSGPVEDAIFTQFQAVLTGEVLCTEKCPDSQLAVRLSSKEQFDTLPVVVNIKVDQICLSGGSSFTFEASAPCLHLETPFPSIIRSAATAIPPSAPSKTVRISVREIPVSAVVTALPGVAGFSVEKDLPELTIQAHVADSVKKVSTIWRKEGDFYTSRMSLWAAPDKEIVFSVSLSKSPSDQVTVHPLIFPAFQTLRIPPIVHHLSQSNCDHLELKATPVPLSEVNETDCDAILAATFGGTESLTATFFMKLGFFFTGEVQPPVDKVLVTVYADTSVVSSPPLELTIDMSTFSEQQLNAPSPKPGLTLIMRALTNSQGFFRIGPFYFDSKSVHAAQPSSFLTLQLHKPGFDFALKSSADWLTFSSQKLALVEVRVVSEGKMKPVPGEFVDFFVKNLSPVTILSVTSYFQTPLFQSSATYFETAKRRTQVVLFGILVYLLCGYKTKRCDLGEYYIQPILKEYEFFIHNGIKGQLEALTEHALGIVGDESLIVNLIGPCYKSIQCLASSNSYDVFLFFMSIHRRAKQNYRPRCLLLLVDIRL